MFWKKGHVYFLKAHGFKWYFHFGSPPYVNLGAWYGPGRAPDRTLVSKEKDFQVCTDFQPAQSAYMVT